MLLDKNPDWTVLVGNYNYTANGCYRTSLNENEIKIFLNILLSPNKFSIGRAISLTQYILKEKNAENIPTEVTFRRYAKWYKANNLDKWTLARDGMKALKDKVEPYIVRDVSMLEVGQVLIADGHTLNFQVINPFTGRPSRATLIGFLDWKSGGLVGYDIMLEENTQNIANALRNAILNMDKVPEYVYQDNGRAFKSKFFNGDSKFKELGFTGVYQKLGITPVYATPYNARGEYIGFVDSDDWVDLDYYEKLYNAAKKYNSDLALGTNVRTGKGKTKKRLNITEGKFVTTLQEKFDICNLHKDACPTNKIYRSEFLKENNITWPEGCVCEDKMFSTQAVYYANGIVSVPDIHYFYFRRPNSTVKTKKSRKKYDDRDEARKQVLKFLKSKNIDTMVKQN